MRCIVLLIFMFILTSVEAQKQDTLVTYTEKIGCKILKIHEDEVEYCFPEEKVSIALSKNRVKEVRFATGRVVTFHQSIAFHDITSWEDWEKVSIASSPEEIKGLFKLSDISVKVKGGTEFSNLNKLKEKAIRKLKIRAAMLGGSILYITHDYTDGVTFDVFLGSSNTAEILLTAHVYTHKYPDIESFLSLIEKHPYAILEKEYSMPYSQKTPSIKEFKVEEIDLSIYHREEPYLKIPIKNDWCTLIYFDDEKMVLSNNKGRRIYNYHLKWK